MNPRHCHVAGLVLCLFIFVSTAHSEELGVLGRSPDWSELDVYQGKWTREDFEKDLYQVYLPYDSGEPWIRILEDRVEIRTDADAPEKHYVLHFAHEGEGGAVEPSRYLFWEPREGQELKGLRIAIDPGHIGGVYSAMEGRHFVMGEDAPVKEGELSLRVAKVMREQLEALGATVFLLRENELPLTWDKPEDFLELARSIELEKVQAQAAEASVPLPVDEQALEKRIQRRSEKLFYRISEIQTRAEWINQVIRPDFTIAIHLNVAPWGQAADGSRALAKENHLHVLVNGTYMQEELALDNVRFEMLKKLLSGNHREEIPLSDTVASSLAEQTGLAPFIYRGKNASAQGASGYLWARNLLANRIYNGPVIFLEAYAANSEEAYARIQAGAYPGLREWNGIMRPNIFVEYSQGVVEGLRQYFSRLAEEE